jgi:hypothetical protein
VRAGGVGDGLRRELSQEVGVSRALKGMQILERRVKLGVSDSRVEQLEGDRVRVEVVEPAL